MRDWSSDVCSSDLEVGAIVEDLSEFTAVHNALCVGDGREEAVVVPHEVGDARLLDCGQHGFALLAGAGDGLLTEDHLACFRSCDGDLHVRVVGRADIDGVDVVARDDGLPVGFDFFVAPGVGKLLCVLGVAAADDLGIELMFGLEEVVDLAIGIFRAQGRSIACGLRNRSIWPCMK